MTDNKQVHIKLPYFKRRYEMALHGRWEVRVMKKMDEMDRNIQLRSKEWGYHTAMLALAGWSLFNSFRTLTKGMAYNPLPGLVYTGPVPIDDQTEDDRRR